MPTEERTQRVLHGSNLHRNYRLKINNTVHPSTALYSSTATLCCRRIKACLLYLERTAFTQKGPKRWWQPGSQFPLNQFFVSPIDTVFQKTSHFVTVHYLRQILTDFQNSFTRTYTAHNLQ